MGNRDTEEMLEAARAECVRLERQVAALQSHADAARRILWVIADRNIGGVKVTDAELTSAPKLPGVFITTEVGMTTIHAIPSGGNQ